MKICHLTVLNPALHGRIFYKWAQTQKALEHEVSIIGQDPSSERFKKNGIKIIPVKPFSRLSIRRFFFSLAIFPKVLALRPELLIIHSPELIPLAILFKLFGAKIQYDVHEDYYDTIVNAPHYPSLIKKPLAWGIRQVEKLASRIFDVISYAELSYDNILKAKADKKHIIRNTFRHPGETEFDLSFPFEEYMLYTGTLAESWGVMKSLELWEEWNKHEKLNLIIAGHTHSNELLLKIRLFIENTGLAGRFQLIGGNEYVPYNLIVRLISKCKFGTALYEAVPWITKKIPTKFYEYMAFDKPLVFSDVEEWRQFNDEYQLGIPFKDNSVEPLIKQFNLWNYKHDAIDFSWIAEAEKVKSLLEKL